MQREKTEAADFFVPFLEKTVFTLLRTVTEFSSRLRLGFPSPGDPVGGAHQLLQKKGDKSPICSPQSSRFQARFAENRRRRRSVRITKEKGRKPIIPIQSSSPLVQSERGFLDLIRSKVFIFPIWGWFLLANFSGIVAARSPRILCFSLVFGHKALPNRSIHSSLDFGFHRFGCGFCVGEEERRICGWCGL